ncbi:MAG TPA: HWE histidine kinase domain-containing protein [Rhizomicrobium sp.]|jgi:PAS domain S-box-containing protein
MPEIPAAPLLSGSPVEGHVDEHDLRLALERQRRTFDLAMVASKMGTWRYTLADNVCRYDRNAQRLYGLTQEEFLHDEEGVKAKFHPDDLERMWAQVAKALAPDGDGRYEVEYRVKQLDGSWLWLSAWGLVEFEGVNGTRKAVAIAGASRDLTERKHAEALQRLLLNELNHRVKNTFAAIQAVAAQTLRASPDLPSARVALDRRLHSMAHAHDLLMARAWTGADLTDVIERALDSFPPAQMQKTGAPVDVPPQHVLPLSLTLHELATNALKYGALSQPQGRVSLDWSVRDGALHLEWLESGGPAVSPPSRKGFGSRLLEALIGEGGETRVSYDPSGVRCRIRIALAGQGPEMHLTGPPPVVAEHLRAAE